MQFSITDNAVARFTAITFDGGRMKVYADGVIEHGDAEKFAQFVEMHEISAATIYLDSPGGSLIEGINLGRTIRKLGFDTVVAGSVQDDGARATGVCASAAVYAFAGGVQRFCTSPSRLGIHQFYDPTDNLRDMGETQKTAAAIVAHLSEMGVSAAAFVRSTHAKSNEIIWLDDEEARLLRLVNEGDEPTTAEIKLNNGLFYLRLEQVTRLVTARVLLYHVEGRFLVSAGIVTTPERSTELAAMSARSYLEADGFEIAPLAMPGGAHAEGSVLWIVRDLQAEEIERIAASQILGIWLDTHGALRWGAMLSVGEVREKIRNFIDNTTLLAS